MLKASDDLGFLDEALDVFLVLGILFWEYLEGDEAIEGGLVGLEDLGHATGADGFHNSIVCDLPADVVRHGGIIIDDS